MLGGLDFIRNEAREVAESVDRPDRGSQLRAFGDAAVQAMRLALQEKEILGFALLQWLSVAVAYYLWVQFLNWIPEDVWKRVAEDKHADKWIDVALLAWSFVCVGIAAFPIGLLTGCMAASHVLRRFGRTSTFDHCLWLASRRIWPLWFFTWIDGWLTVKRILARLPKKKNRESPGARAFKEAIYYAWKLGTLGIVPALIFGHSLVESGRRSVKLLKERPVEVMLLRGGYSLICWVVGVLAYVGAIGAVIMWPEVLPAGRYDVGSFYVRAGIPILVAAMVIQLFVRPVFVLASCELYAGHFCPPQPAQTAGQAPARSGSLTAALVVLAVMVLAVAAVFLFRDEIGLTELLSDAGW